MSPRYYCSKPVAYFEMRVKYARNAASNVNQGLLN